MNKRLVCTLAGVVCVIALISYVVISSTIESGAYKYLSMFNAWSIAGACAVLAVGLFFDARRLITLCRIADENLSFRQVTEVVFSNYFLALFTPGATGGAIVQVLFMKRAGIPVPKATVIILLRTVMSILFLFFLLPLIFYVDQDIIGFTDPRLLIVVALVFFSLPPLCFYAMHTKWPDKVLQKLSQHLAESRRESVVRWYGDFKAAAFLIGKHPLMVTRAFLESGVSLLGIYAVVPVFFRGFGVDIPLSITMGRMCLLNLILYFTPTPGGAGVAEGGFVLLFSHLLPEGIEGIMAVMWRFMCEYVPFVIGAIVSVRAFGPDVLSKMHRKGKSE